MPQTVEHQACNVPPPSNPRWPEPWSGTGRGTALVVAVGVFNSYAVAGHCSRSAVTGTKKESSASARPRIRRKGAGPARTRESCDRKRVPNPSNPLPLMNAGSYRTASCDTATFATSAGARWNRIGGAVRVGRVRDDMIRGQRPLATTTNRARTRYSCR